MVLLTMTVSIVEVLEKLQHIIERDSPESQHSAESEGIRRLLTGRINKSEDEESIQVEHKDGAQVHGEANGFPKLSAGSHQKKFTSASEPSLQHPQVGNPISHGQVIELSRLWKAANVQSRTLEVLLQGSRIYIAPVPPKPEPVSYKLYLFEVALISILSLPNIKHSWLVCDTKRKNATTIE